MSKRLVEVAWSLFSLREKLVLRLSAMEKESAAHVHAVSIAERGSARLEVHVAGKFSGKRGLCRCWLFWVLLDGWGVTRCGCREIWTKGAWWLEIFSGFACQANFNFTIDVFVTRPVSLRDHLPIWIHDLWVMLRFCWERKEILLFSWISQ